MGKFLKPCVGFSVGKMVWSVSSYSEIVNEFLSPENLFGSQKSGRFGVRLIVARSSFRLAYNVLQICDGGEGNRKSLIKIRSFEGIENYSEVVVAPLAQMCLLCAVLGPHVPQIVSVAPQKFK
ncbi:MAG: hypothetical protein IPI31_15330 [Bacteroidetes bacterium]|nr:hypothetical protein [Bacteroidota bacterium]